jgi:hypothetical protein
MKIWYVDINYNYQHFSGMDVREDFLSYVLNFYKSELAKCENND